jgi:carbon storage regulator
VLVLTRKAGERVLIGDDIVITILDTRGDGIRIGIDAPRGVNIQRDEIVRAVSEANVEATRAASDAEARLKAALGLGPDVAPAPQAAPPAKSPAPRPTGSKSASAKPAPTAVPHPPATS